MTKEIHSHNHGHDHAHHDHEHKHEKKYTAIKINKLPHSEIEIEGEIIAEEMIACRKKALQHFTETVEISGFRKGHAPESVLVQKIGEMAILEEAAEIALGHHYGHIIADNNLSVIGKPQITITKLAPNNPLGFKIKVSLFPEIELPDYKKIAKEITKEKEVLDISEKEIDDMILNLRKEEHFRRMQSDTPDLDPKTEIKESDLSPLNDETVKTFGDFKTVDDLKKKVRDYLTEEKKSRAQDKRRIQIGEAIAKEIKTEIPEMLIESELNKMQHQFESDVQKMGVTFADYLKHVKKTAEEIRKEWRKDAESRVKLQITLAKIAEKEKLHPTEKEIDEQATHLQAQYPSAKSENILAYVESMLTNENVFRFLEGNTKDEK